MVRYEPSRAVCEDGLSYFSVLLDSVSELEPEDIKKIEHDKVTHDKKHLVSGARKDNLLTIVHRDTHRKEISPIWRTDVYGNPVRKNKKRKPLRPRNWKLAKGELFIVKDTKIVNNRKMLFVENIKKEGELGGVKYMVDFENDSITRYHCGTEDMKQFVDEVDRITSDGSPLITWISPVSDNTLARITDLEKEEKASILI